MQNQQLLFVLRQLNQFLGVRAREWPLLALMFFHFFVGQTAMTMLQSINIGLFLSSYGSAWLPAYFLAKGILLFGVSLGYSLWLVGRIERKSEMLGFLVLLIFILLISRIFIFYEITWVNFALPIFGEVFVSIFTLQCWALFSDCLDSRQSKRLLPLIGAGGTCGAIAGGWLTWLLVKTLGAENMLFMCVLLASVLSLQTIQLLTSYLREQKSFHPLLTESESPFWSKIRSALAEIFSYRLLWLFMLLIMSVKMASNMIDFQQQVLLKESLGKNEITAYVATYLALANFITLIIQGLFENRLLGRFGPLVGLASTPALVATGSVIFLFWPTLMAITATRFLEQLTHKSIYKTSVNLVYLVFHSEVRRRIRMVINGMLELFAIIPLVLLTVTFSDLPLPVLSIFTVLACATAITLSRLLKNPYRERLQAALMDRRLKTEEDTNSSSLIASYADLIEMNLQHSDDNIVLFSLELLENEQFNLRPEYLENLYRHATIEIRQMALQAMQKYGKEKHCEAILDLFQTESEPTVRQACIRTLRELANEKLNSRILQCLQAPELCVRTESMIFLFTRGGLEGILAAAGHLKALLSHSDPEELKAAAYAIGEIGLKYFRKDFALLLAHPDHGVRATAILAAGQTPDIAFLQTLIDSLKDKQWVRPARKALQNYPPAAIIPRIESEFKHHQGHTLYQSELIKLLETFSTHETALKLIDWLSDTDWRMKYRILKALTHLRRQAETDDLGLFEISDVEDQVYYELQNTLRYGYSCYYVIFLIHQNPLNKQRSKLLIQELKRIIAFIQDILFKLLALLYDPAQIYKAYLNFNSQDPYFRGLSLDVVNYTLSKDLAALTLTFLDEVPLEKKFILARSRGFIHEEMDLQWWESPVILEEPLLYQIADWCRFTDARDPAEMEFFALLDKIYLLKQTQLFANFSVEQLQPVARVCQEIVVAPDTVIFPQNSPGDSLYIIRQGQVTVEWDGQILTTMHEKECFGEVEILNASPRLATIKTASACELLVISREDFIDLVEDSSDFSKGLLAIMSQRLSDAFMRARQRNQSEQPLLG